MDRVITCIVCPKGCEITLQVKDGAVVRLNGALCERGETYVKQEIADPKRNIASSVKVIGGALPLVSCRLSDVIPKGEIFRVMDEIKGIAIKPPVRIGQILIENVAGLGVNVIATKDVEVQLCYGLGAEGPVCICD